MAIANAFTKSNRSQKYFEALPKHAKHTHKTPHCAMF